MTRTTTVAAGGVALAIGSATWAVTMLVADPPVNGYSPRLEILGGLAYQVGLAGFLTAVWLTGAMGTRRGARAVFWTEAVLLALASVWSVVYAVDSGTMEHVAMVVLDATWPLSMVGLVPVGVYVWRARVWPGLLRKLPLVASLWLPLDVAATVIGGDTAGLAFRAAWLAVVWGGLGLLIARMATAGRDAPDHTPQASLV